jgi:hypothetical protein
MDILSNSKYLHFDANKFNYFLLLSFPHMCIYTLLEFIIYLFSPFFVTFN